MGEEEGNGMGWDGTDGTGRDGHLSRGFCSPPV